MFLRVVLSFLDYKVLHESTTTKAKKMKRPQAIINAAVTLETSSASCHKSYTLAVILSILHSLFILKVSCS